MAWENRGNQTYYYRKRRIGGRVVSEYVGSGWLGELAAGMDETDREQQEPQRQAERARNEEQEAIDSQLAQVEGLTLDLTRAVLLLAGYHPHNRQWRKQRG